MTVLHEILARSRFSPVTKRKYARVIDAFVEFAGADPVGWTVPAAQAFYDRALARGVAAGSAGVYIASLRYVSKWYATQMQDPRLDFVKVQTAAIRFGDAEPVGALDEAQAGALLATCEHATTPRDRRDRLLFLVGLETGMRRTSLAAMLWSKREGKVIRVPIKGAGGVATYEIPLSDLLLDQLERWKRWRADRACYVSDAIFPAMPFATNHISGGEPIGGQAIYKIITTRAAQANLDVHPHMLRHSFVTWRKQAGFDAVHIAAMTGHKSLGHEWRNMGAYLDMAKIADAIRNSTPAWLTERVKGWPQ